GRAVRHQARELSLEPDRQPVRLRAARVLHRAGGGARRPAGEADRARPRPGHRAREAGTARLTWHPSSGSLESRDQPAASSVETTLPQRGSRQNEVAMRAFATLMIAGFAFTLAAGGPARSVAPQGIQVADMGMGADGPQLGGSGDDMVLSD